MVHPHSTAWAKAGAWLQVPCQQFAHATNQVCSGTIGNRGSAGTKGDDEMSNDWVDSLERALEVVEGQLMLAKATGSRAVAVEVKSLKKIYEAARIADLERAVVEAVVQCRQLEIESRGKTFGEISDELGLKYYNAIQSQHEAVDALLREREGKQ